MPVFWRSCFILFYCCSLLCKAVTAELLLEPPNSTVLQGSNVQFRASVQGNWEVMVWHVQESLVLTVLFAGQILPSSEQFSATFCSSGVTNCVDFTIHNVTRSQAGSVTCTVQGNDTPKTAQLYVQESGTVFIMGGNMSVEHGQEVEFQCVTTAWYPNPTVSWSQDGGAVDSSLYNTTVTSDGDYFNSTSFLKFQAVSSTTIECMATVSTLTVPQSSSVFLTVAPKPPDWTVLIAVVVSFGSCALLVLLVLGILFCQKRKKAKKTDHKEKTSRTQNQSNDTSAAGERRGQVNPSYEPEGVSSSEFTDSGFFQPNGSRGLEMPDGGNSNQSGNGFMNAVDGTQFQKHRHVTIV